MYSFIDIATLFSLVFLVLSCIEVGSNDATNLVNAVFGSGVLKRNKAVLIAGFFVVLGATFSSPVMDTVRKGIFDIQKFDATMTVSVFIAAYLVSTILLYIYSIFGMPVSTTATLVFCLAGGALGVLQSPSAINWSKFSEVVFAILSSIFLSGFFAFLIQRIVRKALGHNLSDTQKILRHGPWIISFMLSSLLWFMIMKGMKNILIIKKISVFMNNYNSYVSIICVWFFFTLMLSVLFKMIQPKNLKYLFNYVAILGMACMAFAFGQNDLANCASPGVTVIMIWMDGLAGSLKVNIPIWGLSCCGLLMFLGMMTKRAQRVTRAEINTASQKNKVNLYSPLWCQKIAATIVQIFKLKSQEIQKPRVAKESELSLDNHNHYDALRASVILSVGASVIAFASGLGLPVSTTYVAFAAVIASGWGDKVFSNGDASSKIGRTIWVVSGWFLGAASAFLLCAVCSLIIYKTQIFGLVGLLISFFLLKTYCKKVGDVHEAHYEKFKAGSDSTVYEYGKMVKT